MAKKTQGRRFRRPQFSTVIALVALFAVLGGSAYAAKQVINGKNIKKNTVSSKAIKNGTLKTKDISAAAQADLQGQQGPKGAPGAPGADGVINPVFGELDQSTNLPADTGVDLVTIDVPAGEYILEGKASLFAGPGVTRISCSIEDGNNSLDSITWTSPANNSRSAQPLLAMATLPAGSVSLSCTSEDAIGGASNTRLLATPVG